MGYRIESNMHHFHGKHLNNYSLYGMVSYYLWGQEGFPRRRESKLLLSESSLQKLQVEIHFRLLLSEMQQHWPGTVLWTELWFLTDLQLLPYLTPFSPQTATVHSSGYILNQFKNIRWHRPLCLPTSTSPNGSMQHFGNNLYGMRSEKRISDFASEERESDLYSTLWVLSIYGWKSIFSCHFVNVVISTYFQHT